jgi:hypothetical protein
MRGVVTVVLDHHHTGWCDPVPAGTPEGASMSEGSSEAWYVRDGASECLGPLTTDVVIRELRVRGVAVSAQVRAVETDAWTPLASHPVFASVARDVAPPPPAPPLPPLPPWRPPSAEPDVVALAALGVGGFASSVAGGSLVPILLVITAFGVYADAWTSGISKRPGKNGVLNLSPLGWALAVAGLAVVGVPSYLIARGRQRTRSGSPILACLAVTSSVLLAAAIVLAVCRRR